MGCLLLTLLVLGLILCGAMFWGWIIMVVAGMFGWNFAFWPQAVALGFLFSCLLGGGGAKVSR